jgi:pyrroline-5-carboxylate reductase
MAIDGRIAFLGAGNMAGALIRGLLRSGACRPSQLVASDVRPSRLDELSRLHGIAVRASNAEAAETADVLVLATKPQVFAALLDDVAGRTREGALVLSIAAGVPTTAIEARLGDVRVVRAMPNTPALVGRGATAIARGARATDHDVAVARAIFDAVGITVAVDEPQIDAVTGLSGSGPAYVFLMVEALVEGGVLAGLPRDVATRLAIETLGGAAALLSTGTEGPAVLRERVTSPNGTTEAGLDALRQAGFEGAVVDAVARATERARALGGETAAALT